MTAKLSVTESLSDPSQRHILSHECNAVWKNPQQISVSCMFTFPPPQEPRGLCRPYVCHCISPNLFSEYSLNPIYLGSSLILSTELNFHYLSNIECKSKLFSLPWTFQENYSHYYYHHHHQSAGVVRMVHWTYGNWVFGFHTASCI